MITIKKRVSEICDFIILWPLMLLVFLIPFFFLPFTPQLTEFSKQILFFTIVLFGYLAWFGKGIIDKKLILRRTPLDIPILAFLGAYALATVFSADRVASVLGSYGQGSLSLLSVIFYALLYFIVVSNINTYKKVLSLCVGILASNFVLTAFFLLQTFNIFVLPFQFAKNNAFSPLGSLSSLAIFCAFDLTFACAFLLKPKMKIIWRMLILILALANLLILNAINFKISWYVLILAMFMILGFGLAKERDRLAKKWLAIPAFILIFAIFTTTLGIPSIIRGKIPSEVSLSPGLSFQIARNTVWRGFFKFLFGSGPETFGYDFSQERPADFNQNLIWNIRFEKANNTYAELLATTGSLGILTYIVILLIFIGSISLILVKPKKESFLNFTAGEFPKKENISPAPEIKPDSPAQRKKKFSLFGKLKFGQRPQPPKAEIAIPKSAAIINIAPAENPNLKQGQEKEKIVNNPVMLPPKQRSEIVDLKSKTIREDEEEEEEENYPVTESCPDFLALGIVAAWAALFLANLLNSANTTLQIFFWLLIGLVMALTVIARPQEFKKTKLSFKTSPKYALFLSFVFVLALCVVTILFTYLGRIYLADVYYQKGLENVGAKNYEQATAFFDRAIVLNKYRPIYYLALAQNYLAQANIEAANGETADINKIQSLVSDSINESKRATDLAPENVNFWEARGQIYENTTLYSRSANEWVIKSYEKALELEPTNAVFQAKLGRAYMVQAGTSAAADQEENYAKSQETFQAAVALKPDYLAAHYYLALLYETKKQFSEALNEISLAYQIAPQNQDIIYELGRVSYNKAMADNPNDFANNPDFKRSLDAFNLVLKANPNHANALYSLSLVHENLGDINQALEELKKVQALNPDNEQVNQKIRSLEAKFSPKE